jgi:hypothetical protein
MAQEYTPPEQADFDFSESGYTPPADSLNADFDFVFPPEKIMTKGVIFRGVIIK